MSLMAATVIISQILGSNHIRGLAFLFCATTFIEIQEVVSFAGLISLLTHYHLSLQ
jgi:hypothetical protein